MPRTSSGLSSVITPPSRQPAQPFWTPLTEWLSWNARRATARMAALRPGASPPPVRIPIRTGIGYSVSTLRHAQPVEQLRQRDLRKRTHYEVGAAQVEPGRDRVGHRDAAQAGALGGHDPVWGIR